MDIAFLHIFVYELLEVFLLIWRELVGFHRFRDEFGVKFDSVVVRSEWRELFGGLFIEYFDPAVELLGYFEKQVVFFLGSMFDCKFHCGVHFFVDFNFARGGDDLSHFGFKLEHVQVFVI